jgi:peptidyl-prolyl cis-trans isomerase C
MRRALIATILSAIACTIALGALAQEDTGEPPPPPPPERVYSSEDVARRAKVVAKVGDAEISIGDVEDAINEQSPFLRARYRDPAALREFVDGLIRFELLARAAEREDADEDPEVQRAVKQNAVQQLIRRDFDEQITPESIPEADVRAYYDAHPEEFNRDELRRAAHIQVATRAEALALLPRVQAADAREFRIIARDESVDPETRLRGGDLRYFDREGQPRNERDPRLHAALATASFALGEVGDVSPEPIQVGERWSIVKLTGLRPAEHRPFEAAAPTIRLRLWRERRQTGLEEFVERLRGQAGVWTDYDRLRPIRLDPPAREDSDEEEHGSPTAMPPLEAPAPPAE